MLREELRKPFEELLRPIIRLLPLIMTMEIMTMTFTPMKTWMVNVEFLGNSENHP
jgi:hypothetical protein